MKCLSFLLVAFVLSGCSMMNPRSLESVVSGSSVTSDPYTKRVDVKGPDWAYVPYIGESYLLATQFPGKEIKWALVYDYHNKDWAFLDKAYDLRGAAFPLLCNATLGAPGWVHEKCIARLTREYLNQNISGLDFSFRGTNGTEKVTLPGFYVEGFLRAVDGGLNTTAP